MKWQPIETYDRLKVKPKYAVFSVAEEKRRRNYTTLSAFLSTTRCYGSRTVTHWMPLPEPPEEA